MCGRRPFASLPQVEPPRHLSYESPNCIRDPARSFVDVNEFVNTAEGLEVVLQATPPVLLRKPLSWTPRRFSYVNRFGICPPVLWPRLVITAVTVAGRRLPRCGIQPFDGSREGELSILSLRAVLYSISSLLNNWKLSRRGGQAMHLYSRASIASPSTSRIFSLHGAVCLSKSSRCTPTRLCSRVGLLRELTFLLDTITNVSSHHGQGVPLSILVRSPLVPEVAGLASRSSAASLAPAPGDCFSSSPKLSTQRLQILLRSGSLPSPALEAIPASSAHNHHKLPSLLIPAVLYVRMTSPSLNCTH